MVYRDINNGKNKNIVVTIFYFLSSISQMKPNFTGGLKAWIHVLTMNKLNYIFVALALCCCSACGVSYTSLSIERKPEIVFKDSISRVLVINRFDVDKVDFVLRREKKRDVYRYGMHAEMGQVVQELGANETLRLIGPSDRLMGDSGVGSNLDSTGLTMGEIGMVAAKYQADYILALENYDASFVQDEVVRSKNSDGSVGKVASYSLAVESSWGLYDKEGKLIRVLRGDAAKFHSQRSVMSGLLAVGPALGANRKTVELVSVSAGTRIADYFRSQTYRLTRPLYTKKELKESAHDIKTGDYVVAEAKLKLLSKHSDVRVASQAYYNLAVIADLRGERKNAVELAELSQRMKRNMYASMLLNGIKYGDI